MLDKKNTTNVLHQLVWHCSHTIYTTFMCSHVAEKTGEIYSTI